MPGDRIDGSNSQHPDKAVVFFAGFSKPLARAGLGSYEEWKPGKRIRLLLVGYNGARNTGADARVVAIVKQIRELSYDDKYLLHVTDQDLNERLYDILIETEEKKQEISNHILAQRLEYQKKLAEMGRFLKAYIDRRLA